MQRAPFRCAACVASFVSSPPLSIFAEALKSMRRVATLYPVAVPAQQDAAWRRGDELKG